MSKNFGENERRIRALFIKDAEFEYDGNTYKVIENADKPTCVSGEPKTDIFIQTKNLDTGEPYDFKVSYKQDNADFIENKTTAERAELLFGSEWKQIIEKATTELKDEFENKKLIFKDRQHPTQAGSVTLGWKFELLRVKSGNLSNEMQLTYNQKFDVYAGTNLSSDKKNASVNGQTVNGSGVAEYLFEEVDTASYVQEAVAQFKTIPQYLDDYPKIYFACKALNYRTFEQKYDGDRPLSVYVDWHITNGKLDCTIEHDKPLLIRGTEAKDRLLEVFNKLGVKTTDDLTRENVNNYDKIVFEK